MKAKSITTEQLWDAQGLLMYLEAKTDMEWGALPAGEPVDDVLWLGRVASFVYLEYTDGMDIVTSEQDAILRLRARGWEPEDAAELMLFILDGE